MNLFVALHFPEKNAKLLGLAQVADAEERQSAQLHEAEDRAAHVEKEARLRAEATKSAAAAILEKQVKELQLWVSQTEDEFLRTQQRLEVEQVKAQKMIGRIYGMAENLQHRGELCERQAEDMRVESGQEVNQMIADYHHWRAEEMEYLACQVRAVHSSACSFPLDKIVHVMCIIFESPIPLPLLLCLGVKPWVQCIPLACFKFRFFMPCLRGGWTSRLGGLCGAFEDGGADAQRLAKGQSATSCASCAAVLSLAECFSWIHRAP